MIKGPYLVGAAVISSVSFYIGTQFDSYWNPFKENSLIPLSTKPSNLVRSPESAAIDSDVSRNPRVSEIMCYGYPGFDHLRTYEVFVRYCLIEYAF